MFANVGSLHGEDRTTARSVYVENTGMARGVSGSYDEFKKNRDAVNAKWSEFSAFKITKATITGKDGSTKTINFETDLGLTLAGGVKGGASISTSKTEVDLGAAIYISLDASDTQILQNIINFLTEGIQLGIPDTQIYIGPVPIVYGTTVTIGFTFKIDANPHVCFVGLYGGEASFGATYGVDWIWGVIPDPYFNTFGSGDKICESEVYIGLEGSAAKDITWGPWITIAPSLGLGWSSLSVRASVPVTTSFTMTNELPSFAVKEADLGLKVHFAPYFEVSVLDLITIKKDFGTWTLVDGTLQMYPPPVQWK